MTHVAMATNFQTITGCAVAQALC